MKITPLLISMMAWLAAAQAPSRPPAQKLAADQVVTTSGGATFTAPGGWSMVTSGSLIVVEPPEADSHVAIFDSDAATADAAINAAWAAYKRDEKRTKIFEPLEMNSTTFDYPAALEGNHASPHSFDVNGKQMVASMDLNYSIHPHRPAGGVWTSPHDLIRYVQLELAKGKLPNGTVLVSETNLLARRKPYVKVGAYGSYGMGLQVENRWGTPIVFHGGSMIGFKSDILFLPEHGVGAVILTNSDTGGLMLGSFRRRFLEVLFDGKPEAAEDLAKAAENFKAIRAKFRERLVVPADREAVGRLAAHYTSPELGELAIRREGSTTTFELGEWRSSVASRKNDDDTISFITIDPGVADFEFVESKRNNKRALIVREGQHEYLFTESR